MISRTEWKKTQNKQKKNRFLTYKKVRQRTSNDINKNMDKKFSSSSVCAQQIESNAVYLSLFFFLRQSDYIKACCWFIYVANARCSFFRFFYEFSFAISVN